MDEETFEQAKENDLSLDEAAEIFKILRMKQD